MHLPRICVSYATKDTTFAKQLMTDLRVSGAEIITDRAGIVSHADPSLTDLRDPAFEQFLREELPRCQQLIVVQTPAALQSPRLQAIVEAALNYVQQDRMTAVLRVIGSTLYTSEAPVVHSTWAPLPSFDARQNYPRALARLCMCLGLTSPKLHPKAPLPPLYMQLPSKQNVQRTNNKPSLPNYMKPDSYKLLPNAQNVRRTNNKPPVSDTPSVKQFDTKQRSRSQKRTHKSPIERPPHAQQLDTKDRPLRPFKYPRAPRRSRYIIVAVSILIFLVTTSIVTLAKVARSTPTKSLIATATPVPTPTPTPTPIPTPTVIIVTPSATPTPATLSNGTWQGQKTFSNGQSPANMVLTITVNNNTFVGNLTENTLNSQFNIYGTFTSTSSDSVSITFSDNLTIQAGADMCSGCIYTATISISQEEMKGSWYFSGNGSQQGTIDLEQTG